MFFPTMDTREERPSVEDWQTTRETVRDRTAFLFNNTLMSDIKFVVTESRNGSDADSQNDSQIGLLDDDNSQGELVTRPQDVPDGRQVRVPAHKLVLAISSPVFEVMFYGDMAEKGNEIELPDTESDYLLEFLRFIYCDKPNLTSDNVFGVLYLAEKYIVPCLAAKCWSLIDSDPSACLKSNRAASTLHQSTLGWLLKRDSLCVKEFALFDAVRHWAELKCKQNGLEPTGKAVREIMGDAVDFIRFPTMSLEDFARNVVVSGILTNEEALELHQYYARVTAASDIKFPCTYRAGIASKTDLNAYCIYGVEDVTLENIIVSWYTTVQSGKLELVMESRNVHLGGVCLLTSKKENEKFTATVSLEDENGIKLATEDGQFRTVKLPNTTSQGEAVYGFDVKFKDPILLWRASRYTVQVTVECCGTSFCQINKDPSSFFNFDNSVYCRFRGSSRHLFKLLFHKLD